MRIVERTSGESQCHNKDYRLTYFLTDFEGTVYINETSQQRWALPHGTFAFYPPSTPLRCNLSSGRYIQIQQSCETYAGLAALPGGVPLTPRYGLDDPLVSQIVLTIANDMERRDRDYILADALNMALAAQVGMSRRLLKLSWRRCPP